MIIVTGYRHLVRLPEFADARTLAPILTHLEDRAMVADLLLARAGGPRPTITIGTELGGDPFRDCALVTCGGSTPDASVIGVFGPTRMDYPAIVATLGPIGSALDSRDDTLRG